MATRTTKTLDYTLFQAPLIKTAQTTKKAEQDRVIAPLVLAFSSDPAVRWAYPDPHQFLSSFPDFVRAFGGKAFEHGTAHYVDGFTAAALWLPPGVFPDEDTLNSAVLSAIPERRQEEMFAVFDQMGNYHPTEPHWHLPLLGVEPAYQGKGYGSALLRHALETCDRNHQVAYLESSNAQNIPLYERHGFKLLGEIQAGSSPTIYPMTRYPR